MITIRKAIEDDALAISDLWNTRARKPGTCMESVSPITATFILHLNLIYGMTVAIEDGRVVGFRRQLRNLGGDSYALRVSVVEDEREDIWDALRVFGKADAKALGATRLLHPNVDHLPEGCFERRMVEKYKDDIDL